MTRNGPSPSSEGSEPLGLLTLPGFLLAGLLGLFLWAIFLELGPLVALIGALALLLPHRTTPWGRHLLDLLILLGSIWILHKARMVVYPLLAALLVAYWCDPLVTRLERRRIRRPIGALIAIVPVLAVGSVFAIFVLPMLVTQLGELFKAIPGAYEAVQRWAQPWIERYLPAGERPDWSRWFSTASGYLEKILKGLWESAPGIGRGIGAVVAFFGMLVLTPVLAYYLLTDFQKIRDWVREQIPAARREGMKDLFGEIDRTVSSYFRGQVLVALCVGVLFTVGFSVIGLPYALLLGCLAGLLNLIPIMGFWVTAALCIPAAVLSGAPGIMLARLAIVFLAEMVLENQIITPRIVGRAVGLNPAVILVSVLAFGAVLGPIGVLVAVPAAALAKSLLVGRALSTPAAPTDPTVGAAR